MVRWTVWSVRVGPRGLRHADRWGRCGPRTTYLIRRGLRRKAGEWSRAATGYLNIALMHPQDVASTGESHGPHP
jgi:hypothetical protein